MAGSGDPVQGAPAAKGSREGGECSCAGDFSELVRYTGTGYVLGLLAGIALDRFGLERSGLGQWLVRTLSGEAESIFEGAFALRRRLAGRAGSLAEAYGWGKLVGMALPWLIDLASRLAGVDVYGRAAFYIPYFYALGDQMGATVSGFIFLRRRERSSKAAAASYLRSPLMLTSLLVLLLVPAGLLGARLLGFSPTTQLYTALETMAANLCWLPPLVAYLVERRERRSIPPTP